MRGDFRSTRLPLWALSRGHGKILPGPQTHDEVTEPTVLQRDAVQLSGDGEDDVEIVRRKKPFHPPL